MADGFLGKCKNCSRKDNRVYFQTEKGKIGNRKATFEWKKDNKKKARSHEKVQQAIQRGKIKKSSFCTLCYEKENIQGHHEDYSFPLEVVWVCQFCHVKIHILKREEEE